MRLIWVVVEEPSGLKERVKKVKGLKERVPVGLKEVKIIYKML